jgi:hypothetical protein
MRFWWTEKKASGKDEREEEEPQPRGRKIPLPTAQFRHRAWIEFQRAIDPLAPPKPLRHPQH